MRRLLLGLAIISIAALSPCWVHADDQQIAQHIVQQLQRQKADGTLTGFGIDLEVESGIVWLKGHVSNRDQQTMVLDIARNVKGVEQVVNDLRIKTARPAAQTPKPRVRPALLKTESNSQLLKKPGQLLTNLNRSVRRAFRPENAADKAQPKKAEPTEAAPPRPEPTLAAARPTPSRQKAQPVAARNVARKPVQAATVAQQKPTAPSDTELAEDIIGRLRTQKDRGTLRNFDVDVQVNQRVVWISGQVASEAQRSLVLDVSRRVPGVKQVVNDLSVTRPTPVQVVSAPARQAARPGHGPALASATGSAARAPAPFQYVPAQPAVPAHPTRVVPTRVARSQVPLAFAPAQSVAYTQQAVGQPVPEVAGSAGIARARFDNPSMPGYAWPSYAAHPNYGAVTYPRQYSPTAWPYIGPFYPYPQVPLGWRKVTLEWDDGWWMLDFKSK